MGGMMWNTEGRGLLRESFNDCVLLGLMFSCTYQPYNVGTKIPAVSQT